MAGIQLLEQLLRQQQPRSIESPGQLIAELGAQYLRRKHARKLQAQEESAQK